MITSLPRSFGLTKILKVQNFEILRTFQVRTTDRVRQMTRTKVFSDTRLIASIPISLFIICSSPCTSLHLSVKWLVFLTSNYSIRTFWLISPFKFMMSISYLLLYCFALGTIIFSVLFFQYHFFFGIIF